MISTLIDSAIHRTRAVLLILVFIFVSGSIAYLDMPKEAEPDVAIPLLYISISYEGISPEDGERLLIRPMEKELRTIEGLKEMTATAGEGHVSIMLEFDAGFNSNRALQDVLQKVDIAKSKLPAGTEEPIVNEINVALFPILVVTLAGDIPERTLLKVARELKDAIESIPEVLKVEIAGNREEVLEIIIDPLHLESYQLSYEEVFQFFSRNNQLVAAGALDNGQGRFNVKVPGVFETLQDLLTLPVKVEGLRVVTLQDVAQIRRTFKETTSYARVNGKPALALEITKRVGTNIISTIEKTRFIIGELQKRLDWPSTLQVSYIQDKSKDIRTMLSDLQNNVISAVLLVTIVIIAALGLRTAVLVAIAIPGSFLLGILALSLMGLTLNIVVLFSLILASGMLVDGAIIVTEFADRKMSEGCSRKEAYSMAAKRMFLPILTSTITTLVVFIPLLFWPGILGEFMKFLPMTIIATLTASLLMALIFMPTLGSIIGRPMQLVDTSPQAVTGLTKAYLQVMSVLIHSPWLVLLTAFLLLILAYSSYIHYGRGVELFPDVEPEQASLTIRARGDLSVQERDKLVKEVENRILDMPELTSIYVHSGLVAHDNVPEDTIGVIQIELDDWQRRRPAGEIFKEIRQRTQSLAGIIIEVRKPPSGPEQGKPIKIQLSSQRLELLAPATAQLVAYLQTLSGVVDIEDSRPLPGIDWKILVDREQASRFGADISSVGNAVQLVTNGIKVGEYRPDDADEELDIRIRFATDYRHIDQLDRLRLQTPQGLVPVSLFAKRLASPSVGNLRRSDEQRVVTVQADVEEGILVNDKIEEIRNQLREFPLDSSIKVTFKGEDEEQRKAQEFLSRAFISGIFMILIILVMQFNSLYQAVLILSAVILSTIGVLLGLLVTQQPFGIVMSGIGVIALAGIVINNNIILIDTYNILREEGLSPHSAILQTCAQRLRPVLLTAITTVLGLIPMVFKINIDFITREITFGAPSTQWWTQLATAIAGGLTFATALTLILTPCLLMLFSQRTPLNSCN